MNTPTKRAKRISDILPKPKRVYTAKLHGEVTAILEKHSKSLMTTEEVFRAIKNLY